jgi:hypothetical protein
MPTCSTISCAQIPQLEPGEVVTVAPGAQAQRADSIRNASGKADTTSA